MIGVREYQGTDGHNPFAQWFNGLNAQAAAKVTIAITRIGQRHGRLPGMNRTINESRSNRPVTAPPLVGAVLYAKNLERVVAFYAGVIPLTVRSTDHDHVVLTSPVFELVVLRIPAAIAQSIVIEAPPVRREQTPIKLVFVVEALAAARRAAVALGGALNAVEQEWSFEDWRVCDGHDPEGNVFQVRETQSPAAIFARKGTDLNIADKEPA